MKPDINRRAIDKLCFDWIDKLHVSQHLSYVGWNKRKEVAAVYA